MPRMVNSRGTTYVSEKRGENKVKPDHDSCACSNILTWFAYVYSWSRITTPVVTLLVAHVAAKVAGLKTPTKPANRLPRKEGA